MLFTKRNENWAWSQVSIGAALCDVELTHKLVIKINMFASRNWRITWARLSTKKSYGELTHVFSFLCIFSLFESRFCIPFAARIASAPGPPHPPPPRRKSSDSVFSFRGTRDLTWDEAHFPFRFVNGGIQPLKTMRTAKIGPDVRLLVTRKSYQPSRRVLKSCYAANLKRETQRQT